MCSLSIFGYMVSGWCCFEGGVMCKNLLRQKYISFLPCAFLGKLRCKAWFDEKEAGIECCMH